MGRWVGESGLDLGPGRHTQRHWHALHVFFALPTCTAGHVIHVGIGGVLSAGRWPCAVNVWPICGAWGISVAAQATIEAQGSCVSDEWVVRREEGEWGEKCTRVLWFHEKKRACGIVGMRNG